MNPNSKLERLKKQRNELQIKVQEQVKAGKLLQANAIMGKIKKKLMKQSQKPKHICRRDCLNYSTARFSTNQESTSQ